MKTIRSFMSYIMVFALVVFASCKKDNLQDAVVPQDVVAENSTNGSGGTNGTNGTDGTDGVDGATGATGQRGEQGPAGTDGADGQDGADGATGSQGEQGPIGPAGATGSDGEDGHDGEDGAVNMHASNWKINSFYDKSGLGGSMPLGVNPILNQDNANKGFIMVYGLMPDGRVRPLPVTMERGRVIYDYWLNPNLRLIRVHITTRDAMNATFDQFTHFRYVVIPASSSGKNSRANFNRMTYEELVEHFGLEY